MTIKSIASTRAATLTRLWLVLRLAMFSVCNDFILFRRDRHDGTGFGTLGLAAFEAAFWYPGDDHLP